MSDPRNQPDRPDELHDLIGSLLNGSASPADAARLESLLAADREARLLYLRLIRTHTDLRAELSNADATATIAHPAAAPPRTPTLRPPKRLVLPAAIAAALLLAAAAVAMYFVAFNSKPETRNSKLASPLATILETTDGSTLTINDAIANPGDETPGGEFTLDAGAADFRLDNGVAVRLRGSTHLVVHDAMSATLERGAASFECPSNARGYTLKLPGGASVVDLGTRFAVVIDPAGRAYVKVTQGSVRVDDSAAQRRPAGVGRIARLDPAGRLITLTDGWVLLDDPDSADPGSADRKARWRDLMNQVRLDESLAALYLFDAAANADPDAPPTTLANDSLAGDGSDATVHAATPAPGRWPGTTALRFGRPDQHARIALPEPIGSFTIAAWVRLDELPSPEFGEVVATDGWVEGNLALDVTGAGAVRLTIRSTPETHAVVASDAITAADLGRWVHLAATYDGVAGEARVYVNGRLAASGPAVTGLRLSLASARIGNWLPHPVNQARPFPGSIDELAIFRRPLNADEIEMLHTGGRPADPSPTTPNPK